MTARSPSGGGGRGELAARRWPAHLLLAAALLPLVFVPGLLFPYVVPRALAFRVLTEAAFVGFLFLLWFRASSTPDARDPWLWLLSLFAAWSVAGAVAGEAPWRSLFGGMERMGGVVRWIHLLLFYLLLRTLFRERDWRRFFRLTVAAAAVASLAAAAQYHAFPAGLSLPGAGSGRAYGTLGNPGYLAAYLLLALAVVPVAWRRGSGWTWRAVCVVAGLAGLYALLLTGTRAALAGAAAGGLAVASLAAWRRGGRTRWIGLAGAAAGALALVAVAGGAGGILEGFPPLERLTDARSLRSRFLAWGVALEGFPERPVLGVGMENFRLLFGEHFDPRLYSVHPGATRWDRAHNLLLDRLTMSGGVGLLLYLGLWVALLRELWRGWRASRLAGVEAAGLAAGLLAYAGFLFFWFEDLSSLVLFVAVAAFVQARRRGRLMEFGGPGGGVGWGRRLAMVGVGAVFVALVYQQAVRPWRSARQASAGVRAAEEAGPGGSAFPKRGTAGRPQEVAGARALEEFREALGHAGVLEWAVLSRYVRALSRLSRLHAPVRPGSPEARVLGEHVQEAAARIETARRRDPRNPFVFARKNRLYRTAHRLFRDPELLDVAVRSIRRAVELNPRRIRFRHLLASTLLQSGRSAHALEALREARRIYGRFGETYYVMAGAHLVRDDLERALQTAFTAVRLGYAADDPEILLALGERLAAEGRAGDAVRLFRSHLALRYPAYAEAARGATGTGADGRPPRDEADVGAPERRRTPEPGRVGRFRLGEADVAVAARLPVLYVQLGQSQNALAAGQRLLIGLLERRVVEPQRADRVAAFLRDLRAGRTDAWVRRGTVLPGRGREAADLGPGRSAPGAGAAPRASPGG